jgi:ferrochelatase
MTQFDSVLLVAFGGPTSGDQGRDFVKGIVGDRPAAQARIAEVASHYEKLGGSPFNKLTYDQAKQLEAVLAKRGLKVPVRCGFRHWTPWVKDVVAEMTKSGHRKTLAVIMAPHQCWVSWDWYQDTVAAANKEVPEPLQVTYADPWWTEKGYVDASAEHIQAAFKKLGADADKATLVFTAHSIPINMCSQCKNGQRACPYSPQFEESAKAIAAKVGRKEHYQISYQSQASHTVAWTQPDINDLLKELAAKGTKSVVLAPIGFLCDHVEVLYDLDIEAKKTADELGIRYERAETVGSHPAFIELLADRIQARFEEKPRVQGPLVLS